MSIILPPIMTPALYYYSIVHYWPGIDEDSIVEWGDQAVAWIEVTDAFVSELVGVLGELGENTETEIFEAIRQTFEDKKNTDLDPWINTMKTAIPTVCTGVHTGVTAYKSGVIAILVANVAADIPLIASGVGLFIVAAKKAVVQALLQTLMSEALEVAVAELTQVALQYIETYWLDAQKDEIKDVLRTKLLGLEGVVAGDGTTGTMDRVKASTSDVVACVMRLQAAVHKFKSAMEDAGTSEPMFADDSIMGADKLLCIAVTEVLQWGQGELLRFAVDLGAEVLEILSDMLMSSDQKLTEAEQQAHRTCLQLRDDLIATRPVGTPNSTQGPPDFFAPVRGIIGAGPADSDERAPGHLDEPVDQATGTGPARTRARNDLSVLDVDVDEAKGTGAARSDAGGRQPRVDAGVDPA